MLGRDASVSRQLIKYGSLMAGAGPSHELEAFRDQVHKYIPVLVMVVLVVYCICEQIISIRI